MLFKKMVVTVLMFSSTSYYRLDEDKENQSSEVSLPSSLPLPSLLSLMLLRAQWCEGELDVCRAQEVLKRLSEEGCYVSQEHFKLFNGD